MDVLNISDMRPEGLISLKIHSVKVSYGINGVIWSPFCFLLPLIIPSQVTKKIFVNYLKLLINQLNLLSLGLYDKAIRQNWIGAKRVRIHSAVKSLSLDIFSKKTHFLSAL